MIKKNKNEPEEFLRKQNAQITEDVTITGRVRSGAQKAASFTCLEWVESQCMEKFGFKPYPGTLNIEVLPESMLALKRIESQTETELIPPDPSFCSAKVIAARIGSIRGAIVMPSEDVRIHDEYTLEIIAPLRIRDALALEDGDEVKLAVKVPGLSKLYFKRMDRDCALPIKAVIFDLDGTLLDTKEIYFTIVEKVFERLGLALASREAVVEATAAGKFDWDMVLPDGVEGSKDLLPRIREILDEVSPALFRERTSLIPGAANVIKALFAAGVRIGIVTSTRARHLSTKLQAIRDSGLESLFQAVITANEVPIQKPAPDPLLECARRLGVEPGECVYVGDMRVDIRAGKSAGMLTIGVLTGFDNFATLQAEGADLILETVALLPQNLSL